MDLFGIGSALGSLGGSLISGLWSARNTDKTNQANKDIAAETNAYNERMQREQWAREDAAYQRKVADLKAAGLNPALALDGGSPSSLSFSAQGATMQAAPVPDFGAAVSNAFAALRDSMRLQNESDMVAADIASRNAQTDLVGAQAALAGLAYDRGVYDYQLDQQFKRGIMEQELRNSGMSEREARARIEKMEVDNELTRQNKSYIESQENLNRQAYSGFRTSGTWSGMPSESRTYSTPFGSYSASGPLGTNEKAIKALQDLSSKAAGVIRDKLKEPSKKEVHEKKVKEYKKKRPTLYEDIEMLERTGMTRYKNKG